MCTINMCQKEILGVKHLDCRDLCMELAVVMTQVCALMLLLRIIFFFVVSLCICNTLKYSMQST